MPNNVVLTPQMLTRLVLMSLGGNLNVARNMSSSITPEFAKKEFKIGDTVQVRKPYRFVGGDGLDWDPEALVDQVAAVTVDSVAHVHFQWDSVEKTLDIREAFRLYADPAGTALAHKINAAAATFAAQNALHSTGTPGTAPTSESSYLTAGDILVEHGLPEGKILNLIVNRRMSSAYVSGVKALFNPASTLSKQWNKGEIVDSLGYKIWRDQTINTHTVGTFAGTPLVNGANQTAEGGNNSTITLVTDGWTSTSLKKGDKFTIAGVNSVHPQTRKSTGRLQMFTVTADISDSSGAMSPVIRPAITISGQYQNVTGAPADDAAITMVGTTGATAQQGLLMHEDAFAFVPVPMAVPERGDGATSVQETDPETKLVVRYTRYFDGDASVHKHRFDCLYGFGAMYREMACVIQA